MTKYLKTKEGSIEDLAKQMQNKVLESDYQDKFKKALDKEGKPLGQMTGAEKKSFFNKIDKMHKGKDENAMSVADVDRLKKQGMKKESLGKEDKPVIKKVVDKLKGASQAHAGQAKDLEKAVDEGRGRPKKDGAASDELENIQMQLRKSISMRGLKKVQFSNGKHMMVKPGMARAALDKIDSIQMGKDKQKAVKYIMKSPENLKDFVNK